MSRNKAIDEYILCAAIWYRDVEVKYDNPNRLPFNINSGVVVCGHRHSNCIGILNALTGKRSVRFGEDSVGFNVQGFLTNTNRFVDRAEAFRIAKSADQILPESSVYKFEQADLYSESMW